MSEQESPQPNPSFGLVDSQKESNIGDEKEKGISPEEVRKQLDQNTISKYQRLLDVINSSLKNDKISQEQYNQSIANIDHLSEKELGFKVTEKYTSQEKAKEIMGKYYLGSEAVEKAFGIKLEINEIPAIPFSMGELEKAKKLGQFLVLRVNSGPDGQPLTMQSMNNLLKERYEKDSSKVLYNIDWYEKEEFFTNETPKLTWALTSKEVIPNSTDKNYLEQIDAIVDYLNQISPEGLPEEYQKAVEEYKNQRAEIEPLIDSDWEKAAGMLEELKITELTRQSPAEALYDLVLYFQTNGEKLLPNRYICTKRRASDGKLVNVGGFGSGGVCVYSNEPDYSRGFLGTSFSRSQ